MDVRTLNFLLGAVSSIWIFEVPPATAFHTFLGLSVGYVFCDWERGK